MHRLEEDRVIVCIAIFNNITPRLLPRLPHITDTHLQDTYFV